MTTTDPARDDAQTTDPETTMPDKTAATSAPPRPPPPAVPVMVQVLDRAVDLAAIAGVVWICLSGRLSGELAVVAIGAIAGAQTGLRSVLTARGGPSVGVAGLVLLAGLTALSAPATAAAAGGVAAAAAGAVGQRGHAQLDMLLLAPLAGLLGAQVIHALPATWRYPVLAALTVAAILLLRSLERTIRPKPRAAERGHARPGVLALLVLPLLIGLAACPPRPTPEPGPSQPVSGWTSTARAVLSTLRWALPAARAVTDSLLSDPPRTQVARALDAAADASVRLDVALSAYESRGGDRCVAHAAAGGVVVALEQLADVLADNGIALGVVLGRVVDGAASIVDALVPACAADAGWTSAGDLANGRLRLTEDMARRRGIALRRDLDAIAEPSR